MKENFSVNDNLPAVEKIVLNNINLPFWSATRTKLFKIVDIFITRLQVVKIGCLEEHSFYFNKIICKNLGGVTIDSATAIKGKQQRLISI